MIITPPYSFNKLQNIYLGPNIGLGPNAFISAVNARFMNFVSGKELTKYVCAADLYIQPGSISQTCQTAVCCGTPLCFNVIPTHREIYNGNGFFVESENDIYRTLQAIGKNPDILKEMSRKAYIMANEELDYHIIYTKILASVGMK